MMFPQSLPQRRLPLKWIAVGVAIAVVTAATYVVILKSPRWAPEARPLAVQEPVTVVAVLPFYNGSGDSSLDWIGETISDALMSEIGQSVHLRLVSASRLRDVLHDLRVLPEGQTNPSTMKGIKDATGAEAMISGQVMKVGDQFRINATVHDLSRGLDTTVTTDLGDVKGLPAAVVKLARQVRGKLATTWSISRELQSSLEPVLTDSVSALQTYEEGVGLARAGDNLKAAGKLEAATTEDPNFALAFSQLALAYARLGNDGKAQQASRRAVELSSNLPAGERSLVEANHARIMHQTDKAIVAYEALARLAPGDTDVQFALAGLYENVDRYDDARKRLDIILAVDPNDIDALYAMGRVDIKDGKSEGGLSFLTKGLAQAIKLDNKPEKSNFLNAMGIAYENLGKRDDALVSYQQALEIYRSIGDQRGTRMTLTNIAGLQDTRGNSKVALANFQEAIEVAKRLGDKDGIALSYLNLGSFYHDHGNYENAIQFSKQALQIYRETGSKRNQAQCLNNIGSALNYLGQYQDALTNFDQAYQIRDQLKLQDDAAESLQNSASMNFKLGQFETAESQFLKALKAGQATDNKTMVALTSSGLGELFATQGQYDKALEALDAAVKGFQPDDRRWLAVETLANYGNVLSMVGRSAEGQKYINEAMKLADQAKMPPSVGVWVLNCLADSYFYRGDYSSAAQQYRRAIQVAGKPPNSPGLGAQLGLARTDLELGRPVAALPVLKKITQEANSMGLRALAVEASIFYAQGLLASNRADIARQQLEDALGQAEGLGMQEEVARAHYLLAGAVKPKDAEPHYEAVVRILESLSKQPGASHILDRADLKGMYSAAKSDLGSTT